MNHTREIADARFWAEHGRHIAPDMAQIEAIERARGARADAMRAMPRDTLIRIAPDVTIEPEPRPHLLRRLVWPGVALCVVGLLALGVLS